MMLDDLEEADPTEHGTVMLDNQMAAQMKRIQRASSRTQSFQDRMWSWSAATWETKEACLAAFSLNDMLQERQAARDSRYGDRNENYLDSIKAYGLPDGSLLGEFLADDVERVKSTRHLSKEAGVSEETWQSMEDQAKKANESEGNQEGQEQKNSKPGSEDEESSSGGASLLQLPEAFVSGKEILRHLTTSSIR